MGKSKDNQSQAGSFLPAEYVKGKSQFRANVMVMFLFTLVIAGVVGAFVVNHQRWRRVHQEQGVVAASFEEEAAKIEQLQSLEKQRVDLIERAEVVTALKDRVPRSVLVGEIVRAIPDGLTLTLFNLEGKRVRVKPPVVKEADAKARSLKGKSVGKGKDAKPEPVKVLPPKFEFMLTTEGIGEENDHVADFLASLKASPLFENVELQFIKETKIEKKGYRRFKITMSLLEQADARLVDGTEEIEIGRGQFGIAGQETDTD